MSDNLWTAHLSGASVRDAVRCASTGVKRTMFERYTERARSVIFFARVEASQFGSTTIETEHLLLGWIRADKNLPNRFLGNHSSIVSIKKEIEGRTTIREKGPTTSIDLPLSNECKRILAYAAEETERLNHPHIGTEHLLLGILREEKCVAAEILHERGLRLNAIREELIHNAMPPSPRRMFNDPPPFSFLFNNPVLPKSGVVPDAATAIQIAEAVWTPMYGAETIASQTPFEAKLNHNVWIVIGSGAPETALFAFILQADGRILSVGRGSTNA
jgi:NTF2 fold immunity protein/Clp amino terminal domain, pathogenicity island component